MLKRHKDLLRAIVAPLRNTLAGATQADGTWQRGDLDRELERLGMAPDGALTPMDALPNASAAERRARYAAEAAIATVVPTVVPPSGGFSRPPEGGTTQRRADARSEVIERAAYTWINRLLALRAMEARGLIDETLRGNPDYDGVSEALYILRSDAPARSAGNDGGWWAVLEDACTAQAESLPGLFDLGDPAAALRPSTAALLRCLALVGAAPSGYTLEEADAAFADPDAIGWCYQFYQEAAKARVYAKLGSGGKAASRAEIAAATQLFTEPYMVQWLLQNSLGRSYHEAYPDSALPATWDYYIRQEPTPEQRTKNKEQKEPTSSHLQSPISNLQSLTLIDPCCGSGHFLREAFDMFAAMYRERLAAGDFPPLTAAEIADRVLERHLHGIDLDPRAAQLAALTLYLRAWEFVRDEGRRAKDGRRALNPSSIVYRPSSINIATTPSGLSAGALQRHLRRHPEDRVMTPLLEGVFAALEQADILGSLLRPAEHIDAAMKALQAPHTMQMDFDADDAALRRTITALAGSDPAELKRMLLERVAQSFHAEAGAADDVAAQLFGREAEGGVRLLQLLDRKYAVVVTNPPYMDNKNMDLLLRRYIEHNYAIGKRDLYSVFILRCLEMNIANGRLAMVTQQGWMFLRSFADLRSASSDSAGSSTFTGILQETCLDALVHLGRYAFSEIGNAAVAPVLFVSKNSAPHAQIKVWSCRMKAPRPSEEQAALLLQATTLGQKSGFVNYFLQIDVLSIPETPVVYWLQNKFYEILRFPRRLRDRAEVRQGLVTSDNTRFTRYHWEVLIDSAAVLPEKTGKKWYFYAKAGKYQKWVGLEWLMVDWEWDGARIQSVINPRTGGQASRPQNVHFYFQNGLTYNMASQGSLGVRVIRDIVFDQKSPLIYLREKNDLETFAAFLSTRACSYILRVVTQSIDFSNDYVANLPIPESLPDFLKWTGAICILIKRRYVTRVLIERIYDYKSSSSIAAEALLLTLEGIHERLACQAYQLRGTEVQAILSETGTPAGFHPLLAGYDALPDLPADLELPPLPQEVVDYLAAHQRIAPPPAELQRIKARLRAMYEGGPGAATTDDRRPTTDDEDEDADGGLSSVVGGQEDDEAAVSGAHIPIPTETFLEELSVKLQIHPISVYWLLEELRREGARCKPEELRLLEDRLSVLVLRLLGHRWPRELDESRKTKDERPLAASSFVLGPSSFVDNDGIIPISGGTGEQTLAERLRGRLRAEDGDLGAQRAEALLHELTGLSLEDWLRREFFKRHVRQFKYRPIAWHLASKPAAPERAAGRRSSVVGRRSSAPAFECLVYYHACGGDVLARIRTQYVEPLLRGVRQQLEHAGQAKDDSGVLQANLRIQELEEFNRHLQTIAERGFTSPELDKLIASEPLDRWSGDGYLAPADQDALLRQEQGWRVDLNDGVRVNIAPVQLAGLLASDVLKAVDAKKAIADRARWRSDERRWVRAGKLPRCGWMGDDVYESAEWNRLAPQREAERVKLEEKRRAVTERRESAVE